MLKTREDRAADMTLARPWSEMLEFAEGTGVSGSDGDVIIEAFHSGWLICRFERKRSEDGSKWIAHGCFVSYHPNGAINSIGQYTDGKENGRWRVYHDDGALAAEGDYAMGRLTGIWQYWDKNGIKTREKYGSLIIDL